MIGFSNNMPYHIRMVHETKLLNKWNDIPDHRSIRSKRIERKKR